ncbi:MAG: hypothetical protein FWF29_10240 [Treponema sp.]|nr:hypothetical protein [Treponema sp.]
MTGAASGVAQYLARFGDQSIACNQYALAKLGVDRSHCFLKIEDYMILCVPFQFGFKRSLFLASLSKQELTFFQRYINGIVGLSIAFLPPGKKSSEPIKFFIRCTLSTIGPMKDRENVGLFVLDYKATPDDLVTMLGGYLENQERIKIQYEDYGASPIKITPDIAKMMGYNLYATITEPNANPKRIQVYSLSTKTLEHLEAAGSVVRPAGTSVAYQLYFKKFRVSAAGSIVSSGVLPQGLVRTKANLSLSPELVEIIDDYWYNFRMNPQANNPRENSRMDHH